MVHPSIVWFRQDLRLKDQPALQAAIQKGGPIIPLFIWAPEEEGEWAPGGASRWWLHGSLASLQKELKDIGLNLILRKGSSLENLLEIVQQTEADAVFWNRRYEPLVTKRDHLIHSKLVQKGIQVEIFNGSLLFEAEDILNKQDKPYQVFGHFWKYCCKIGDPSPPISKPTKATEYKKKLSSHHLDEFQLLPKIPWDREIKKHWIPGEAAAQKTLKIAIQEIIKDYVQTRNIPSIKGTSQLSPYLYHGEISPRIIWHEVKQSFGEDPHAEEFLRQIGWRDFAYYLLHHFPHTTDEPLRTRFRSFDWLKNQKFLQAWQRGLTGYPIIDAGMRQLWDIGWMHNRVRMIVGSFLVKDLRLHWLEGARWFWDTLLDADLANNTLGWQWVAGCGADAAPYFRVFNPITQGQKFDKAGEYVRRWVPELAALPDKWIHCPWKAPEEVLKQAGVVLNKTYPTPVVDHDQARKDALQAYRSIPKSDTQKTIKKTSRKPKKKE